jgi:undecaprenyl-diphosphatase
VAAPKSGAASRGYAADLLAFLRLWLQTLLREPTHSRRAEAGRRFARMTLLLTALLAVAIFALMFAVDAWGIGLMPPYGTASLWPLRILTAFGKSSYVLMLLAALLLVIALVAPRLHGTTRGIWMSFGTRIQFLLFAVLVPVIAGELLKGLFGRGRPFVGGEANPFNFSYFSWSEAYASFPSGHSITAFALAFAVSTLWPRLRGVMIAYALMIAMTRLVLLAHHPSDVVGGALTGVVGAMAVRYWFAARRLGFAIGADGAIRPLEGPSAVDLKKVAQQAFAP